MGLIDGKLIGKKNKPRRRVCKQADGTRGEQELELRASMSLCRPWESWGSKREAAELLGSGYDGFAEDFETADLREARALLEERSSASEGRTI